MEQSDISKRIGNKGMVGAQRLFLDCKLASKYRLGLSIAALVIEMP
jgi:hypothetical protein